MNSPLSIIISREYLERVKRKSFIITTLLVPLLMIICMVAPALFMLLGDDEQRNIAVIDDTAQIAQLLRDTDDIRFTTLDNGNLDAARADDDYDAILAIGARAIDNPEGAITLYTRGAASMNTDTEVTSQLNRAIEDIRLRAYNIDNIRQILKEVEADVTLSTVRIDTSEDTETSSILSYFLGLIMDMLLYMFILIYGQIVMNSIIEEKNNRVLEIVVSSVKPMILMMGKIIGVGLVAITQILIWAVIAGAASGWLLPFLHRRQLRAGRRSSHTAAKRYRIRRIALRLHDTLLRRRLFLLFIHICRHRLGCRQHPGCRSTFVRSHNPCGNRYHCLNVHYPESQHRTGILAVGNTVHLTHGDDVAPAFRSSRMGNNTFPDTALRFIHIHDMAMRKNIPCRNIHVRQKTDFRRTHALGTI